MSKFFTGKPCRACGGTERYTVTGRCRACHCKRDRRRYRTREEMRHLISEAKNHEWAAAEHHRVRWVFDWRGPYKPSEGFELKKRVDDVLTTA